MKLLMENWKKFVNEDIETEEQAAQWLAQNIAPLIDAADAGNFNQPLAQLVAKLNTPEGASPAVRALLKLGDEDAKPSDEVIKVAMGQTIPAPQLVPTQGVIDLFKSVGFNGSNAKGLQAVIAGTSAAPPILVAGNGGTYYIIDGHHRWSGATVFNTNCKIPANVIVMDPGKALLVSQLAIAAYLGAGKAIPSASAKKGRSIIGSSAMDREQVEQALLSNVGKVMDPKSGGSFMNPKVIAVIGNTGYGQGTGGKPVKGFQGSAPEEEAEQVQELTTPGGKLGKRKERLVVGACAEIADNCGALAQKYSSEGPPREIMPQFDPDKGGPDFSAVKDDFAGGKLNFAPTFTRAKKAAE